MFEKMWQTANGYIKKQHATNWQQGIEYRRHRFTLVQRTFVRCRMFWLQLEATAAILK